MILRVLLAFVLFFSSVIANESNQSVPLADTNGEPSGIVNGSVSVITGSYLDHEVDLVVPGSEPLTFSRSYCSNGGALHDNWRHNHAGYINFWDEPHKKTEKDFYAFIMLNTDQFQSSHHLHQRFESNQQFHYNFETMRSTNVGYTNTGGELNCGTSNLRNMHIYHPASLGVADEPIVTCGSGEMMKFSNLYGPHLLANRYKPNGTEVHHTYFKDSEFNNKIRPERVFMLDKAGVLKDEIRHEYLSRKLFEQNPSRKIHGINGQTVFVKFQGFDYGGKTEYLISHVVRPELPDVSYEYELFRNDFLPRIIKKSYPKQRYLMIQYYKEGVNDVDGTIVGLCKDHGSTHRVMLQKAPVGWDDRPIVTYKYFYKYFEKPKDGIAGSTDVIDAYGHKTTYAYDKEHRLVSITRYSGNHEKNYAVYSIEKLVWGKDDQSHNLLCRTLSDNKGVCFYGKVNQYDRPGNVIETRLYGNLSGTSKSIALDKDGIPISNSADCRIVRNTFCSSGKIPNLVATQQEGNRKIAWIYLPDTNLPTAKYTYEDSMIKHREHYTYNANGLLIETISDDGSTGDRYNSTGVTYGFITRITPKLDAPAHGLPLIVEKFGFKAGEAEQLIEKHVYHYSKEGRLIRQDHYDGDNQLRYSLTWEYDLKGNVIAETNALGEVMTRQYDENKNLLLETSPRGDHWIENTYDFSNRLAQVARKDQHGNYQIIQNKYNYLSQKTSEIDSYGNETRYDYDEFGRITRITLTEIADAAGKLAAGTIVKKYNHLDQCTSETDPLGHEVKRAYNLFGKPTSILYPDGTLEQFEYNLNGTLKKSTAKNGSVIRYEYDYQDRIIKQETYSPQGELLLSSRKTYNAFHLLAEVDHTGLMTTYTYDARGRLASVTQGTSHKEYAYDALGRQVVVKEWYGELPEEVACQCVEYDLLNRVIEERTEDSSGKVLKKVQYAYDADGNRTQVTQYPSNMPSTSYTEYDFCKRVIKTTDPLGNTTYAVFDQEFRNAYGQRVLRTELVDPLGSKTCSEYNARGALVRLYKQNSLGQILSERRLSYDQAGNKTQTEEDVYAGLEKQRTIVTQWEYNTINQVIALHEAVGTPHQKTTRTRYNLFGEKEAVIKSDGVEIRHQYDALGRLERFYASNRSFYYVYRYDQKSDLVEVEDHIHNHSTLRFYDEQHHILREMLANGLDVHYRYDRMGRPIKVILPDDSEVKYSYDALNMREIERVHPRFKHKTQYVEFDLAGRVLFTDMAGECGIVRVAYDGLGRHRSVEAFDYAQRNITYDAVGNLIGYDLEDHLGKVTHQYGYDLLNQLHSEKGDFTHAYQNDSLNNRIKKDDEAYVVNELNQVVRNGLNRFDYDVNGNLKAEYAVGKRLLYDYDALDRLIKVEDGVHRICYEYDAFNRRLSKRVYEKNRQGEWVETGYDRYVYQGQNESGCYREGKAVEYRVLGIAAGAEIGGAVVVELGNESYVPIHDHNGNVRVLKDTYNGDIIEVCRYTAFGEEKIYDWYGIEQETSLNPYRFASKRFDPETGLIYFGRRYYRPEQGRWLTKDPLGYDAGPNLYAYVLNSPLFHFDLYGLFGHTERDKIRIKTDYYHDLYKKNLRNGKSNVIFYDDFEVGKKKSRLLKVEGSQKPGRGVGYIPGVENSEDDAMRNGKYLSDLASGYQIDVMYNPDHNLFRKLEECKMGLNEIATPPVRMIHEGLDKFFDENPSEDARYLLYAHSHGGILTKLALKTYSEERRSKVHVVAIAPGGYPYSETTGSLKIYRAKSIRDFIPDIDRAGARRERHNTVYLQSHPDSDWHDHAFDSPTYKQPIVYEIKNFLEE